MTALHEQLRTELTERFKKALTYLLETKQVQKSSQGDQLSYGELATVLFGEESGASTFSQIVKGKRLVNFTECVIMAKEFGFDMNWMMTGEGEMLATDPMTAVALGNGVPNEAGESVLIKSCWSVDQCFDQMQRHPNYHIGNGTIVLTPDTQKGILNLIERYYLQL